MKVVSFCIIIYIILQCNTISVSSGPNTNGTTSELSVWVQKLIENVLQPLYDVHSFLKNVLSEGNSEDDLRKDLTFLESFMHDVLYGSDHSPNIRVNIGMAKLIAFKQALKYKNNDTLGIMEKKQIERYLQIGDLILILSDSLMKKYVANKIEGESTVEQYFLELHNEITKTKINSLERDMELQKKWAALSRSAGSQLKTIIDTHFEHQNNIAKVGHILGIYDPVLMWNYLKDDHNALSTAEMKNFWKKQLKPSYQRLMSFVRNDFQDIYTTFNGIEKEVVKFPAYLFDTLYHIHSPPETIWAEKVPFTKLYGFDNIFNKTINLSKKYNAKSLTIHAEKYYQSLGFSKLGTFFWQNSIFRDLVEGDSDIRAMNIGTKHATVIIKVHGMINFETFQHILNVLFEVHRGQILQKKGHPSILWEPDNPGFTQAFQAAVLDGACSVQRLTKLGILKQQLNDNDKLSWSKGLAVRDFITMASGIQRHTWINDILDRKISVKNRIREYWDRRLEIELVVPTTHPSIQVNVTTDYDFFHGNQVFYIGFGLSHVMYKILWYQIYARLCELAGQYNPTERQDRAAKLLYECDFSNSPAAGELIRTVIEHGGTKTWRELLDIIMGTRNSTLSATGLLHYHALVFNAIKEKDDIERMFGPNLKI